MNGFVIPTTYTAVDRMSRVQQGIARANKAIGQSADAAAGRMQRAYNLIGENGMRNIARATAVGGAAIIGTLGLAANEAIKFEDRMADVAKTTQLTGADLKTIGDGLMVISKGSRTSISDLQKIAEIGGQFGVRGVEGILAYTDSVNKFNVALGGDFSGGVEEASRTIGGLNVLFKETKKLRIDESITRAGSAINALSAQGVAVPELTEFMSRIGQLPDAIKPSIQDVAALGAVFNKSGITAEISSRAVGDVLMTAANNIPAFAKQMHVGQQALKGLLNNDPAEFLKRFSASLKGMDATSFTKAAGALKLGDSGSLKIIGSLSTATDKLTQFQKIANDEFAKGTSILDEYNIKNNTTAAKFDKAKNIAASLAITVGDALLPVISGLMDTVTPLVSAIADFTKEHTGLMSVITPAIGVFGSLLLGLSGFATVIGVVTKASAAWNVVQKVLNGTMKANPIGVVLTIVGLLITAIAWVTENTEGWGKQWDATVSWMKSIGKALALDFQLKFFKIGSVFEKMVNTIVKAWYWAENKLGMISDQDYKNKIANINATEKAHLDSIAKIQAAYDSEMAKVMAGPGMHISMKSDRKDDLGIENGGVTLPNLASTNVVNTDFLASLFAKQEAKEVKVTVSAAPGTSATVDKNGLKHPKVSNTFQNNKF